MNESRLNKVLTYLLLPFYLAYYAVAWGAHLSIRYWPLTFLVVVGVLYHVLAV